MTTTETDPGINAENLAQQQQSAAEILGSRTDLIVVGLDGSECSRNAAEWAAAEATRRHAPLLLVHTYTVPVVGYPGYLPLPEMGTALHASGTALLATTARELRAQHPSIEIRTHLAPGDAVAVLRDESAHAQLTVVGSRGAGRVAEVILGSVAIAIASDNPAPVAVIHPEIGPTGEGPVLVGVDGSPTSEAAVAFAFEAAAVRHTDLLAVHCWFDSIIETTLPSVAMMVDPDEIDQEEHELLSERLAGWREKYPDVVVRQSVVHGRPTPTLLDAGREAQLVVVGSRGRGGFAGLLLGSTGQSLITHCSSPVVVVRPNSLG